MSADGPPPKYYPEPPPVQNVVIVTTNCTAELGDCPVQVTCPHCNQCVLTEVQYVNGTMVWLLVIILLIVFWPLMCIPCCIDQCKDVEHLCPSCHALIGIKKRL